MSAPEKSLGANGWLVSEIVRSIIIAKANVAVAVTGTTNETALFSVTVPKGLLGPNGVLRVTTLFSFPSSANSKIMKVKLGGTTFLSQNLSANATLHNMILIRNRNDPASQVTAPSSTAGFGASASAVITGAVDTSQDQELSITGQLANAGETITLEAVLIEVL